MTRRRFLRKTTTALHPNIAPSKDTFPACSHPEAEGVRWGDQIHAARQAELQAMLDAWTDPFVEQGDRRGPFDQTKLTGADVYWLVEQLNADDSELVELVGLHLEGANLRGAHLEGAILSENFPVFLQHAELQHAHCEKVYLAESHMEFADLSGAYFQDAILGDLTGAILVHTHLEGGAATSLNSADLYHAYLDRARFNWADLEYANFLQASIGEVNLREARLYRSTALRDTTLYTSNMNGSGSYVGPYVADTRWGDVNLSLANWTQFIENKAILGDEYDARNWEREYHASRTYIRKQRVTATDRLSYLEGKRLPGFEKWSTAARANRQLATALSNQGMSEEADYFAYRAQVCQQRLLHLRGKHWRAGFSRFLDLLAGYGYRPQNTLVAYLIVIAFFTVLYLLASHRIIGFGLPFAGVKPLQWYQAIILSISAFHGRGFFQETPGDPVALCAAIEAIFGLIIEASFIATFTQRFFGTK